MPPEKSKPDLASAIATLRGELERVRKELVVAEETWSETQAKIAALKQIANEKFRSQMAQLNAKLKARRYPEGLPVPDPNDIPEEQEIERLRESLRLTTGPPVIDQQVRMSLLWLSPDPLAKVVLDELDKLLRNPSLENVNGMIAFLAKFPEVVVPLRTLRDSGGAATLNRASEQEAQASPPVGDVQFRREHRDGVDDERRIALGAARRAAVMPILVSKGWTRCKLATKAGVSRNSVYEYLNGKRKLSPANRRALAEALSRKLEDLPN